MILRSIRFHYADGTWRESVVVPPRGIDWEFLGDPSKPTAMTVTTDLTPEEFQKYWNDLPNK
jgi:hypothetical protein